MSTTRTPSGEDKKAVTFITYQNLKSFMNGDDGRIPLTWEEMLECETKEAHQLSKPKPAGLLLFPVIGIDQNLVM